MAHDSKASKSPRGVEGDLRKHALGYPEAEEDFPWGHRALKVRGKAFAYLVAEDDAIVLSVKLPKSKHQALVLSICEPTGYGLGKAGWVTARIPKTVAAAKKYLSQARDWIDESYRAIAPKKLIATLKSS